MPKTAKVADDKPSPEPAARTRMRTADATLPESLRPACESPSRHVRDLRDTSTHFARQALDCFEWEPRPAGLPGP